MALPLGHTDPLTQPGAQGLCSLRRLSVCYLRCLASLSRGADNDQHTVSGTVTCHEASSDYDTPCILTQFCHNHSTLSTLSSFHSLVPSLCRSRLKVTVSGRKAESNDRPGIPGRTTLTPNIPGLPWVCVCVGCGVCGGFGGQRETRCG